MQKQTFFEGRGRANERRIHLTSLTKRMLLSKLPASLLTSNNTFALTLTIAESRTEEKEIINVVINLINRNN